LFLSNNPECADFHDSDLRQIAQVDALGNWSQTTYDSNANVSSSTDALGYITQYVANGRGLVTKITDANGDVTQDQYYADGDLQTQTNARGLSQFSPIAAGKSSFVTLNNIPGVTLGF
jgi:YD repeat-containing protein